MWILQVIGFLLYLADGDKVNINKLKQLNLGQVDTVFKVRPAVFSQLMWMIGVTFGNVGFKYNSYNTTQRTWLHAV